jgi:hypothetical protein
MHVRLGAGEPRDHESHRGQFQRVGCVRSGGRSNLPRLRTPTRDADADSPIALWPRSQRATTLGAAAPRAEPRGSGAHGLDQTCGNALCDLGILDLYERRYEDAALALPARSRARSERLAHQRRVLAARARSDGAAGGVSNGSAPARGLGRDRRGDRRADPGVRSAHLRETATPVHDRLAEPPIAAAYAEAER